MILPFDISPLPTISPIINNMSIKRREVSNEITIPPSPLIFDIPKPMIAPVISIDAIDITPTRDVGFLVEYAIKAPIKDNVKNITPETNAPRISITVALMFSVCLLCLAIFIILPKKLGHKKKLLIKPILMPFVI